MDFEDLVFCLAGLATRIEGPPWFTVLFALIRYFSCTFALFWCHCSVVSFSMSSGVCQLPSGVHFERSSVLISRLLSSSTLLKYPFLDNVVPKLGLPRSRIVSVLTITTQRPPCPRRDLRGPGRGLLSFQKEGG